VVLVSVEDSSTSGGSSSMSPIVGVLSLEARDPEIPGFIAFAISSAIRRTRQVGKSDFGGLRRRLCTP
jgi:hypothetical protein